MKLLLCALSLLFLGLSLASPSEPSEPAAAAAAAVPAADASSPGEPEEEDDLYYYDAEEGAPGKSGKKLGKSGEDSLAGSDLRVGEDAAAEEADLEIGGESAGKLSKKGGKPLKKPSGAGFRVAGEEEAEACPVQLYQIVSRKFPAFCLNGGAKRVSFKACGKTASAANSFELIADGDNYQLKHGKDCVSGSSLAKGPCDKQSVKVVRVGAFHQIQFANGKCLNAKTKKQSNLVKCNKKVLKMQFRVSPVFDQPATDAPVPTADTPASDASATGN